MTPSIKKRTTKKRYKKHCLPLILNVNGISPSTHCTVTLTKNIQQCCKNLPIPKPEPGYVISLPGGCTGEIPVLGDPQKLPSAAEQFRETRQYFCAPKILIQDDFLALELRNQIPKRVHPHATHHDPMVHQNRCPG